MSTQDNDPLHIAINAKLASAVADMASPPAWYQAWQALRPASTEEQRLQAYQAIRDSGVLPPEAGFYLVAWQIDAMTSLLAEDALRDLDEKLSAIQAAYELEEGDFWPADEAPEEYEQLHRQYMRAWDKLVGEQLERHGEDEMARLFRTDPDGFEERSQLGRQHFHGPDDPEYWLTGLAEAVASATTANSLMGPPGFRYSEDDGCWVVLIYPRPVDLVGGSVDGEVVASGFSLDLEELRSLFDRVDDCSWQTRGFNDNECPHVSIEGIYQGRVVVLRVLTYAPDDEEPGLKVDTE